MYDEGVFPRIADVARLFADHSRATMCMILLDGQRRTLGELAGAAGIRPSTASEHLTHLVGAKIVTVARNGRQRCFGLAGDEVAAALETLASMAPSPQIQSLRQARASVGLAEARYCYDHLAGKLGVMVADALFRLDVLTPDLRIKDMSPIAALGVELGVDPTQPVARLCPDWTERRYHLAGVLAARLVERFVALEWLARGRPTQALAVTALGRDELERLLAISWRDSRGGSAVRTDIVG